MHKIPVFREPEDENQEKNDDETAAGPSSQQPKETPAESANEIEFAKFPPEVLDDVNAADIASQLQKEEEYLKTLSPNLNTLQDYEKKVCPSIRYGEFVPEYWKP